MKKIILLALLFMFSTPAFADVSVDVKNAGAWPTTEDNPVSAILFDITNNGPDPINLTSMTSPAGAISLYESRLLDAPLIPLAVVTIAPGETVSFAPEQKYILLENAQAPLNPGDIIKVTINFNTGSTTIDVPVLSGMTVWGPPPKPRSPPERK